MYCTHSSTPYRTPHHTKCSVYLFSFILFLLFSALLCFASLRVYSGSLLLFCSAASVKLSALCSVHSAIYTRIHAQYYRDISLFLHSFVRLSLRSFVGSYNTYHISICFPHTQAQSVGKNITVCQCVCANEAAALSMYLYGVSVQRECVRFYLFV